RSAHCCPERRPPLGLAGVRLVAVELPVGRQRDRKLPDALHRALSATVKRDIKSALAGDADLDLVALLQLQRLDNHSGKPDGKAVAPFTNSHDRPLDIHRRMYIK